MMEMQQKMRAKSPLVIQKQRANTSLKLGGPHNKSEILDSRNRHFVEFKNVKKN